MRAQDYAGRPNTDEIRRAIIAELKKLDEPERYTFILEMIRIDPAFGIELANRSLRSREFFEKILREGLRTADASSVRDWLAAILPRLGTKRVLAILKDTLPENPKGVRKASYWL